MSGDPAEFFILFGSSWVVFNEADKPAVRFLDLDSRGHQAHDLVDYPPLKHEKLEDLVPEGGCDRLSELFARNGRDAECRILRRAATDIEVEEIGSLRLRDLTADTERCYPVKRGSDTRG